MRTPVKWFEESQLSKCSDISGYVGVESSNPNPETGPAEIPPEFCPLSLTLLYLWSIWIYLNEVQTQMLKGTKIFSLS